MSETDAYLQLIAMSGLILSIPFFWRVCFSLGKLFIVKFFPPKYLTIEIENLNGEIKKKRVNINDNKALIEALLLSTGERID
ncbi:MAG: hypothetical protein HRT68_16600 [Flavobacteriaceae bacterium]|nr:hypothetical protein [Flavobacteriaceae bacterium]